MAKLSYLVKYQQVRQRAFPRVDHLKGACKDKIRPEINTLAYFASSLDCSVQCKKLVIIYKCSYKARVFVPGKPFQPSFTIVSKAGAYQSETAFRCSLQGRLLAPINIRLGWKGLPGTNIQAYFASVGAQEIKVV